MDEGGGRRDFIRRPVVLKSLSFEGYAGGSYKKDKGALVAVSITLRLPSVDVCKRRDCKSLPVEEVRHILIIIGESRVLRQGRRGVVFRSTTPRRQKVFVPTEKTAVYFREVSDCPKTYEREG